MDRAEKLGLGTAVGGHILLLGAMLLGLLFTNKPMPKPAPITVSLVGEIAPVSTAPDAIQEEPAPAAPAELQAPADPPPSPEIMQIERPVERQVPTPLQPTITKPQPSRVVQKTPAKPVTPTKPATKPATAASGRGTTPAKPGSFSDSFERAINGANKTGGQGKAVGTPAAKTASQVRSAVTVSLRNEISPFFKRCAPSGIDVDQILTSVTLSIAANGGLISVGSVRQSGVNESNSPQASLHKDCVLKAVRAASPYQNLPADSYDVWKNWPMEFRTR
jgi:periplasmic protein TonB